MYKCMDSVKVVEHQNMRIIITYLMIVKKKGVEEEERDDMLL